MKTMLTPKSTFLLEAPLQVLHSQSQEWLAETEFWKDEVAFFYSLVVEKTKLDPTTFSTKESKDLEKHLVFISAEKINDLKLEIQEHEKFLSRLLENSSLDEQLYRSRHKSITEKIHAFETEFKEMKRKVFILAEKANEKKKAVTV